MDVTTLISESLMTSYYVNNVSEINNTSFVYNTEIVVTTAEWTQQVAESLQATRFIVQNVLTPVVVAIGLLGNSLNILVLFQPSMRTSTNMYLLVLSIADSVFLVFNFALSLLDCRKKGLSYTAYHFNPFGRFVSNFSGNVAVWVTVVFTVERYIVVCHPINGKVWCTVRRAKLASLTVGILTLVNTVPTIFELEVIFTSEGPLCKPTILASTFSYEIGYSWWYVTAFTFIPLIFLTIFNIVLIRALLVANKNRQQLVLVTTATSRHHNGKRKFSKSKPHLHKPFANVESNFETVNNSSISDASIKQRRTLNNSSGPDVTIKQRHTQNRRSSREQNKVTLMLITIVMIFLLCQLPWTALYLYRAYISGSNRTDTSSAVKIAGNICNILQLVNASGNFYLYSCFSKRFRRTFRALMFFWRR